MNGVVVPGLFLCVFLTQQTDAVCIGVNFKRKASLFCFYYSELKRTSSFVDGRNTLSGRHRVCQHLLKSP